MKKTVRTGVTLIALVIIFVLLAFWAADLRAQQPVQVGSEDDGAAESALNAQIQNSDADANADANFNKNAKATVAVLTLTMTPVPLDVPTPVP